MPKLSIEGGLLAMAGDLRRAAVLGLLMRRALEHGRKDSGRIKIATIAEACGCGQEEVITHLLELESGGCLRICGGSDLEPGRQIGISALRLEVVVTEVEQPRLPLDGEARSEPAPIRKPHRLEVFDRDEVRVGDDVYHGSLVPQYVSDSSDVVASVKLSSWVRAGDAWNPLVLGKEFAGETCVVDAWLWWEESIGWRPGILEWCEEKHPVARPLKLDRSSFEAFVAAMREGHPEHSEAYDKALTAGSFALKQPGGKLVYKVDAKGLRWPGLDAVQTCASDGEAA